VSEPTRTDTPPPEPKVVGNDPVEEQVTPSDSRPDARQEAERVEVLQDQEPHKATDEAAPPRQGGGLGRKWLILALLIVAVPVGWLGWRAQDYHADQGHWPTVATMKGWLSGQVEPTPFERAWQEQHRTMQSKVLGLERQNSALSDRVQTLEEERRELSQRFDALASRLEAGLAAQSLPVQTDAGMSDNGEALAALGRRLQTLEQQVAAGLIPQATAPELVQALWDRGWFGAVAALVENPDDRRLAQGAQRVRGELLQLLQGGESVEEEHYWGGLVTLRQGASTNGRQATLALLLGDWQGLARAIEQLQGSAPQTGATFEQFEALRRQGEGRWASSAS